MFFARKATGSDHRELFRQAIDAGSTPAKVADAALGRSDQPGGAFSPDFRLKAYLHDGDVFVKDLASGDLRQLTRTSEDESSPFFFADGKRVGFRRGDAWMVRDLESDLEWQAVDVRTEKDRRRKTIRRS